MSAADRLSDGYEPDHDIDREVGRQAELFVANLIDALGTSAVEIKHDVAAQKWGNAYFEIGCNYPKAGWRKTGVYGTKAELWVHVLPGPESIAIVAPVSLLRGVVDWHRERGRERRLDRGSHPTVGVSVPLPNLIPDLMAGRQPKRDAA